MCKKPAVELKPVRTILHKPPEPKPVKREPKELILEWLNHQLELAKDKKYKVDNRTPIKWWWMNGEKMLLDVRMGVGKKEDTVFLQYEVTKDTLVPTIQEVIGLIEQDDDDMMKAVNAAHQAMLDRLEAARAKRGWGSN